MDSTEGNYLGKIKATIITNNQYGILEVLDLENIITSYFNREEYSSISQLIKTGEIEKIKTWKTKIKNATEYVDILLFSDQDRRKYIVSIYDNEELWQDPEVIEIVPITAAKMQKD